MKDDDSKITLEIDLMNISDKSLIYIRNRVMWECKRRIVMGIKVNEKKKSDNMKDIKYWKKELKTLHPTEYIDLVQAIRNEQKERVRTVVVNGKLRHLRLLKA